jgi:hypothetical protein
MAGKCKACHSELLSEIDDRLRRGDTCESIAVWCNANGLAVATPSINRHRDNHVDGIKTPEIKVKSESHDMKPIVDFEDFIDELYKETDWIDVKTSVGDQRRITQLLLEKILQNQLMLVHELQVNYANCKGSYPDSQIRGLKVIFDMVGTLPTYNSHNVWKQLKSEQLERLLGHIDEINYREYETVVKENNTDYYYLPVSAINAYLIEKYGDKDSEERIKEDYQLRAKAEKAFYSWLSPELQATYKLEWQE